MYVRKCTLMYNCLKIMWKMLEIAPEQLLSILKETPVKPPSVGWAVPVLLHRIRRK